MHLYAIAVASTLALQPAPHLPEQVKIGAFVLRLSKIDAATDSFSTVVFVWTKSRDLAIADNQHLQPITTLSLGDTHSSLSAETHEEKSRDGSVWGSREFDATLDQKLDVRHFPFDHHTLKIRIVETQWSAKTLVYVADSAETRINPHLDLPGWEITGCRIQTHLLEYPTRFGNPNNTSMTSTWSEAWILIDVRRNGIGVFAKLVLVAYISFALMMLSFLMDSSLFSSRVSMLVGCLFATVLNMRGAEAVLGRTDDFTLVDQIHLMVAFFIFVSATTGLITRRMETTRARRIHRWTASTALVLFLIANVVLIGTALRG